MFKRVIGSKIIRSYDKDGNFTKEVNIIEYESVIPDWLILLIIMLVGAYSIGHYA